MLQVTKFQHPSSRRFRTVLKKIGEGGHHAPSCQIGLTLITHVTMDNSSKAGLTKFWELFTVIPCEPKHIKQLFIREFICLAALEMNGRFDSYYLASQSESESESKSALRSIANSQDQPG